MARPRRANDDELIDRIVAALEQRVSTTAWSLADVAPAAGISPAGLLKRFGSKSGLLRAMTRRWVELLGDDTGEPGPDALRRLREYVAKEFGAASPAGAVFAISEVLGDLQDPELAALLAEGWRRQAGRLTGYLRALQLAHLSDPDSAGLLLLDALHGSLFRSAADSDSTSALATLDRFLELWK